MVDIDDVCQVPSGVAPKSIDEGCATTLEDLTPTRLTLPCCRDGVEPESLYFYRFADPWRDHAVTHARVHPRQLHARRSRHEQSVRIETDSESRSGRVAADDLFNRTPKSLFVSTGDEIRRCAETV
jgi:hypothetical protein